MQSLSEAKRDARRQLADEIDPLLLAQSFLGEDEYWFDDEATQSSLYRLRRWRGDYYYWLNGRYRQILDETVRINLTAWLQKDVERVRAKLGFTYPVTRDLVANILLHIDAIIIIMETRELNSWLDFQDRPPVIPLRNGLLSLADFDKGVPPRRLGHTPNYFNTACLPFDYDPQADCPLWKHFLDDVMLGRTDLIQMLQQWVGYLFRPDLREQKFLLCVGEGANGKGVFFEVVQALVGRDNCSQVPLCRFGNPFALWPTYGKLLNATSESTHIIEEEAEGILKAFVAGDAFTFERKYRDPFHAAPTAKVMIATNALPHFNDKTQGIWRRVLLAPFDKTIAEANQIRILAQEIIRTELPGVFNWAIAGLETLNRQCGFTIPDVSRERLEEHRRDVDPARTFLLNNYSASLDYDGLPASEVYASYVRWSQDNGFRPVNSAHLGRQVKRAFPSTDRVQQRQGRQRIWVYRGLAVQEGSEVATAEGSLCH
ncbi:MAG: hypothetical protein KBE65_13510 [Phycisphaerae bacterium]|nr:hypothetical protein [Phycisphaerae bacterium]